MRCRPESPAAGQDAPHISLGRAGEDRAARHLNGLGYAILARNWRHRRLELDIVCRDGDVIVFVEVKTRSTGRWGGPAPAVTPAKQRHILRAAQAWLKEHDLWQAPCRCDVLCLVGDDENTFSVEHFRNAFDFSAALDSRNAPWQPW
ncbi:MAG: YraN family protein [Desulfovibrio sp.]|nr:YraN family protein [Desulfovibrio sp.]